MKLTLLVYIALLSSRPSYLQVNGNEITTTVSTDNDTVYECNFKNVTNCKMQIDVGATSYWLPTKSNANPPITDTSDQEGIFLVFPSSEINSGVHSSVANTPEFLLPTGKGTLSFKYYLWDMNDPLQLEYPKLKIFSCGNYTRAIWKRTGDKIDKWIQANIYLSCREKFKISFEATVNGSKCGVAIDDIVVKKGHVLPPDPTTRSHITTIQAPLTGSGQPKDVIATTFPESKQDHHTMWILIAIIIALAFVIIVGISVHCCIYKRNRLRKKADEEKVDADAKRKRFQESKSGGLTTSGYMTLTKSKSYDVTNTADLGAIDLTITSPKPGTTFGNGKSLPRLPSLPDEAKKHQHSINMDVTYDYVDDVPADSSLPKNLSEDRTLAKDNSTVNATSNDCTQDTSVPPVYFTLSPTDQGYSHLSEYSTMPDVVKVADDSGLNYKPSLATRNVSCRRKSSLSSLREKLSKGLSNASNEYEELKSDDYYEEVKVECQL